MIGQDKWFYVFIVQSLNQISLYSFLVIGMYFVLVVPEADIHIITIPRRIDNGARVKKSILPIYKRVTW